MRCARFKEHDGCQVRHEDAKGLLLHVYDLLADTQVAELIHEQKSSFGKNAENPKGNISQNLSGLQIIV
jgi:hypothetical protein